MTDSLVVVQRIVELEAKVKELESIPHKLGWMIEEVKANKQKILDVQAEMYQFNSTIDGLSNNVSILAGQINDLKNTHEIIKTVRNLLVFLAFISPTVFLYLDYYEVTPIRSVRELKEATHGYQTGVITAPSSDGLATHRQMESGRGRVGDADGRRRE